LAVILGPGWMYGRLGRPPSRRRRLFGVLDWLVDCFGGEWAEISSARLVPWRLAAVRVAPLLVALTPVVAVVFVAVVRAGIEGRVDVRAEAVLFEDFLDPTRGPHDDPDLPPLLDRATCRASARDGRRVVEDGSHDELVAAGLRYAELFLLQAERFRD